MSIIAFFVLVLIVVVLGWVTIWLLGQLAPGHPPLIDNIVWIVVVLIILVTLANAVGLLGSDPMIPRLR